MALALKTNQISGQGHISCDRDNEMSKTTLKKVYQLPCVVFLLVAESEHEDHYPECKSDPAGFEGQQCHHPG